MKAKSLFLTGALLFQLSGAWATDYYVDIQNGENLAGSGAQGDPWRNISYALVQISGTGHTLHVAPGTYDLTPDGDGIFEIFPIQLEDGVSLIGDQGAEVTILDAQQSNRVMEAVNIGSGTTIRGLTIRNGTANDGAGFHMTNSSITLDKCTLSSNTAGNSGGGIYIDGGIPSITNCLVKDNNTSGTGGGGLVATNSSVTIVNSTITSNSNLGYFPSGGGLKLYNNSSAFISQNIISYNSMTTSSYPPEGSGVYIYSSYNIVLSNNWIEGNTQVGRDDITGGVACNNNDSTISGNMIINNEGIGLTSSGSQVENNTIMGNTSIGLNVVNGGEITNNTITTNGTDGVHYSGSPALIVRNNMLSDNGSYGMNENDVNSDITAESNLFFNNGLGVLLNEGTTAVGSVALLNLIAGNSGNLSGDPLFLDEANNDFRITSSSPAKDAGSATGAPTEDIDGEPRPNGAGVDIGADEYYAPNSLDTNNNFVIDNFEMLHAVDDWANASLTQGELDALRALWSCLKGYRSDGAGGFTCR